MNNKKIKYTAAELKSMSISELMKLNEELDKSIQEESPRPKRLPKKPSQLPETPIESKPVGIKPELPAVIESQPLLDENGETLYSMSDCRDSCNYLCIQHLCVSPIFLCDFDIGGDGLGYCNDGPLIYQSCSHDYDCNTNHTYPDGYTAEQMGCTEQMMTDNPNNSCGPGAGGSLGFGGFENNECVVTSCQTKNLEGWSLIGINCRPYDVWGGNACCMENGHCTSDPMQYGAYTNPYPYEDHWLGRIDYYDNNTWKPYCGYGPDRWPAPRGVPASNYNVYATPVYMCADLSDEVGWQVNTGWDADDRSERGRCIIWVNNHLNNCSWDEVTDWEQSSDVCHENLYEETCNQVPACNWCSESDSCMSVNQLVTECDWLYCDQAVRMTMSRWNHFITYCMTESIEPCLDFIALATKCIMPPACDAPSYSYDQQSSYYHSATGWGAAWDSAECSCTCVSNTGTTQTNDNIGNPFDFFDWDPSESCSNMCDQHCGNILPDGCVMNNEYSLQLGGGNIYQFAWDEILKNIAENTTTIFTNRCDMASGYQWCTAADYGSVIINPMWPWSFGFYERSDIAAPGFLGANWNTEWGSQNVDVMEVANLNMYGLLAFCPLDYAFFQNPPWYIDWFTEGLDVGGCFDGGQVLWSLLPPSVSLSQFRLAIEKLFFLGPLNVIPNLNINTGVLSLRIEAYNIGAVLNKPGMGEASDTRFVAGTFCTDGGEPGTCNPQTETAFVLDLDVKLNCTGANVPESINVIWHERGFENFGVDWLDFLVQYIEPEISVAIERIFNDIFIGLGFNEVNCASQETSNQCNQYPHCSWETNNPGDGYFCMEVSENEVNDALTFPLSFIFPPVFEPVGNFYETPKTVIDYIGKMWCEFDQINNWNSYF